MPAAPAVEWKAKPQLREWNPRQGPRRRYINNWKAVVGITLRPWRNGRGFSEASINGVDLDSSSTSGKLRRNAFRAKEMKVWLDDDDQVHIDHYRGNPDVPDADDPLHYDTIAGIVQSAVNDTLGVDAEPAPRRYSRNPERQRLAEMVAAEDQQLREIGRANWRVDAAVELGDFAAAREAMAEVNDRNEQLISLSVEIGQHIATTGLRVDDPEDAAFYAAAFRRGIDPDIQQRQRAERDAELERRLSTSPAFDTAVTALLAGTADPRDAALVRLALNSNPAPSLRQSELVERLNTAATDAGRIQVTYAWLEALSVEPEKLAQLPQAVPRDSDPDTDNEPAATADAMDADADLFTDTSDVDEPADTVAGEDTEIQQDTPESDDTASTEAEDESGYLVPLQELLDREERLFTETETHEVVLRAAEATGAIDAAHQALEEWHSADIYRDQITAAIGRRLLTTGEDLPESYTPRREDMTAEYFRRLAGMDPYDDLSVKIRESRTNSLSNRLMYSPAFQHAAARLLDGGTSEADQELIARGISLARVNNSVPEGVTGPYDRLTSWTRELLEERNTGGLVPTVDDDLMGRIEADPLTLTTLLSQQQELVIDPDGDTAARLQAGQEPLRTDAPTAPVDEGTAPSSRETNDTEPDTGLEPATSEYDRWMAGETDLADIADLGQLSQDVSDAARNTQLGLVEANNLQRKIIEERATRKRALRKELADETPQTPATPTTDPDPLATQGHAQTITDLAADRDLREQLNSEVPTAKNAALNELASQGISVADLDARIAAAVDAIESRRDALADELEAQGIDTTDLDSLLPTTDTRTGPEPVAEPSTEQATVEQVQDTTADEPDTRHVDQTPQDDTRQPRQAVDASGENAPAPRAETGSQPVERTRRDDQIYRNLAALRLAVELRETGQHPDAQQRSILESYNGWGAFPKVFDERETKYREVREEIKEVTTAKEYNQASNTITTAFYTPEPIIDAMWDALQTAGLDEGTILEPGCGSGDFIRHSPDNIHAVGVEIDAMSALIASALNPDAEIRRESFTDTKYPDGTFTATIGNVPYGQAKPYDPVRNTGNLSLHNYFASKSVDLTTPGGYIALVTSRYTADAEQKNTRYGARDAITENADLITAVRLPSGRRGAFYSTAGTEALTDVLILRKRTDGQEPTELTKLFRQTTMIDIDGEDQRINRFFAEHPDHILGTLRKTTNAWGLDQKVDPTTDTAEELGQALAEVLQADVAAARTAGYGQTAESDVPAIDAEAAGLIESTAKENNTVIGTLRYARTSDGIAFEQYLPTTAGAEPAWAPVKPRNKGMQEDWAALIDLRDTVQTLQQASKDGNYTQAQQLRAKLNQDYDEYVGTFGFINRHTWAKPRVPTEKQAQKAYAELERTWRVDNAVEDRPFEGELPEDVAEELWDQATSPVENLTPQRPHLTGAIKSDPFMNSVYALETYSVETGEGEKGAWFSTDPLRTVVSPDSADTIADAIEIADYSGQPMTTETIAKLMDADPQSIDEQLDDSELLYRNPADPESFIRARTYLSGAVRTKIAEAEKAAETDERFAANVTALENIVPEKITQGISMNLGATWIPQRLYRDFIIELTNMPPEAAWDLNVQNVGDMWQLVSSPKNWDGQLGAALKWGVCAESEWGDAPYNFSTKGPEKQFPHCGVASNFGGSLVRSAEQAVVDAMNQATPTIGWSKEAREELGKPQVHSEATRFAARKAVEIREQFDTWVKSDPERYNRLVDAYNLKFNNVVAPSYDGSAREMPGLGAKFQPYSYQLNAVERMVNEPGVLLNHVVGAGKTGTMIMGAMELKRTGKARQPWMVVPNHLVEQISREANQWYPAARVLSGGDARSAEGRQRFLAQASSSDWDLVVVPESAFTAMALSKQTQQSYIDEAIFEMEQDVSRLEDMKGTKASIKKVKQRAQAFTQTMERRVKSIKNDDGISFEDSGCDYLIVDEAHNYKNLYRNARLDDLASAAANKATDLDMKIDWLRRQKRDGAPVVTFATGTPISNNIGELWVMQHYLRPDLLQAADIDGINAWGANFTEGVMQLSFTAGNRITEKERLSRYLNIADLSGMCTPFMDVVRREQLTAKLPELRTGGPVNVTFAPGQTVTDAIGDLAWREDNLPSGEEGAKIDNPLKIVNDGKAATLDPRLANLPVDPDPSVGRINAVCDKIIYEWENCRDNIYVDQRGKQSLQAGGLQIVFCDKGVPSKSGEKFSVYDGIRDELVARGMDRDRIRFIHEWDSRKLQLFDDCNNGKVDVLIGNTPKLGTGANIQARAIALHHVDVPWRPADIEQQLGRALRQGNQNDVISNYRYIAEGTYDGYSWTVVLRKQEFIEQFMTADPSLRTAEALESDGSEAMAQTRALATGNPDFIEQIRLTREVTELESAKMEHEAAVTSNRDELAQYRTSLPQVRTQLQRLKEVAPAAQGWKDAELESRTWSFGTTRTDREAAAEALCAELGKCAQAKDESNRVIGEIGGVVFNARYSFASSCVLVTSDPGDGMPFTYDEKIPQVTTDTAPAMVSSIRSQQYGMLSQLENRVRQVPRSAESVGKSVEKMEARVFELENLQDGGFERAEELIEKRAELEAVNQRLLEFDQSDAQKQLEAERSRRLEEQGFPAGYTLALNPTSYMIDRGIECHPEGEPLRKPDWTGLSQAEVPPRTIPGSASGGLFHHTIEDQLRAVDEQGPDDRPDNDEGPQQDSGPNNGPDTDDGPEM